jgi:hypothetical protein
MIEIISYILLGWGYLTLWFFAVGTYIMLIPGVILDFLFNVTYGTLHYKQIPKDWLFSGTTARILRETVEEGGSTAPYTSKLRQRALRWQRVLNAIDPGHIK